MIIVKWIAQNEITLYADEAKELEVIKAHSIRLYKHPRIGSRLSEKHFYIRYESDVNFSTGPYQFPDNPTVENLCLIFNELEFVFWGTFKTEIAPLHFMKNMQRKQKIRNSFRYIEAGEDLVKTSSENA